LVVALELAAASVVALVAVAAAEDIKVTIHHLVALPKPTTTPLLLVISPLQIFPQHH